MINAFNTLQHFHSIIKRLEKMLWIKPFRDRYKWKNIDHSSGKGYWKKLEKNNPAIFLIVLYSKDEKLYSAYTSKYNLEHDR